MVPTELREQVRDLIRHAKTQEALEVLSQYAEQNGYTALRDKLDSLFERLARAKQDFQVHATMPRTDFDLEINRIHTALKLLLDEKKLPGNASPGWAVYAIPILLLILAAAGVGFWLSRDDGNAANLSKPEEKTEEQKDTTVHTPTTSVPGPSTATEPTDKDKDKPGGSASPKTTPADGVKPPKTKPDPPVVVKEEKPEMITVIIFADACWQNARVYVDGQAVATIKASSTEFEMKKKGAPSTIRLETTDKFKEDIKTLKNSDRITFSCN